MPEKETIGVIQEFGDLGGTYSELSEQDKKAYVESVDNEKEEKKASN